MPNKLRNITHHPQRHTTVCLCVIAVALAFASCSQRGTEVHFDRFERLLFDTPAEHLQEELLKHRQVYSSPLLNVAPNDRQYMQLVHGFVSDSTMRYVYHVTDSLYHDLQPVERQLGKALARAEKIMPGIHYDHFYTLLTGDYDNYANRVFCDQQTLCVSIDHYALSKMQRYNCFGVPLYLQRLLQPEYIVPDCMAAIARAHIALPDGEMTLLDYAVAEGKTLYFVEQTLPSCPDTLLLRYSKEQLQWMQQNEQNVWGWLLQQHALFSTDYSTLRNLVDEAPKTNAFGDGSAPRTVAYLGLQIVKAYMKKSHASMADLFDMTDSQRMLNESGWRP